MMIERVIFNPPTKYYKTCSNGFCLRSLCLTMIHYISSRILIPHNLKKNEIEKLFLGIRLRLIFLCSPTPLCANGRPDNRHNGLLLFSNLRLNLKHFVLTPRFPMCEIGAFWPWRRDCTRLRDRIMSWIV